MAIKSITQRWALNTLMVILLVLVLVNIGFVYNIHNYFYSGAKQMLTSSATSDYNLILLYSSDTTKNITKEIQGMVENFPNKDKMELMSIDYTGKVYSTSSGFKLSDQDVPEDYLQALSNAGTGYSVSKLPSGEKIMAVTRLVPVTNNRFSALRYVVSLEKIDSLIFKSTLLLVAASLIVLLFVLVSGGFFVNSIVRPVREMSVAVRKIAQGDMSVRIRRQSKDELGQLCESINYMADEISNSERLKNEFISSVSHELRTPLTAIQGWSETIMSMGVGDLETTKKGMRVISNETGRLSDMVEELLDFSRIQDGRFKLNKDRMDILAELEEAVLIYTEHAHREGKQLIYHDIEMLPFIFGDRNRIRQVFINIIDNALKYSDEGDTVTVKAEADEKNIIITVSDTGCGIAEKDLPLVKEKFYKANNTRRGSGIGLAVAVEIVSMHDGSLEIDSEEGIGTTVTVTLPIDKGQLDQTTVEFTTVEPTTEIQI